MAGCSSCRGEPVPFGLDAGGARPGPASPAPEAPEARPPFVSVPVPPGHASWTDAGAAVEAGGEELRAVALWDLEPDGDRDVLLITAGNDVHGPRVLVSRRGSAGFAPASEVAVWPGGTGCIASQAGFAQVDGAAFVVASVDVQCPAEVTTATRVLHRMVLDVGTEARLVQRFALRVGDAERPAAGLSFGAEDRDADGHSDLHVDVQLGGAAAGPEAHVRLGFFDRPAGLALDPAEPDARITTLATEAHRQLRRHPEAARATATSAVALFDALCRGGAELALEVGGQPGVGCPSSSAAAKAIAVVAQAAAREGDARAALASFERLGVGELQAREVDVARSRTALGRLPTGGWTVHRGPSVPEPAPSAPEGLRVGRLAFLDESRLLIRSDPPLVFDVDGGASEAAAGGSLELVDPSGTWRVQAVERRCEGTVLRLGRAGPLGAVGPSVDVPVAPRPAPWGAACPELAPRQRADDDGWDVLGWAPQGALLARAEVLRLVPLDVSAQPSGAPVDLAQGVPAPSPILAGHATADARAWASLSEFGILLVERIPELRTTFLRPATWDTPSSDIPTSPVEGRAEDAVPASPTLEPLPVGAAHDVAVSPSARRIAWVHGGRVRWFDRAAPSEATTGP